MEEVYICEHPGLIIVNGCPLEKKICCQSCKEQNCKERCSTTECQHKHSYPINEN
jgi:hypothetical protein